MQPFLCAFITMLSCNPNPKDSTHLSVSRLGLKLTVETILYIDGLESVVLRLDNHSPIPFRADYVGVVVRDRYHLKRSAQQTRNLKLVSSELPKVEGEEQCRFTLSWMPLLIDRDKELVIEIGELEGQRQLELIVYSKTLRKIHRI